MPGHRVNNRRWIFKKDEVNACVRSGGVANGNKKDSEG
jgi:hypothetical protein